ncbi:MAG: radical SAM protein [Eubacteriales bacterium]|nr:radical SAM protein [Eubacteriales bacterium]
MICTLCPRRCGAWRDENEGNGFCHMGTLPMVSRAAVHRWEEPCISGKRGSGTIFFTGCSLGCVFCQNERISHHPLGRRMSVSELSELFRRVEELGVHNINLVTPTHFAPAILEALSMRKPSVPVVWNSSGYEALETIQAAKGLVDVYLPDFKYFSEKTAADLADAPDYFPVALAAIQAMCSQTGLPVYDEEGMMLKGTMVRHLILPLRINESLAILDTIADQLPKGTPVSLMRQYTPMNVTEKKGLDRLLTAREYARVFDHMLALGLDGYVQEKKAADSGYTPDFMDEESVRLFPT